MYMTQMKMQAMLLLAPTGVNTSIGIIISTARLTYNPRTGVS
jgi:hypothetical protein